MNEHELQKSIIAECNLRANQDPRWGHIFAVPNGGKRSKATAGKLKAEGVRPGVPDLLLLLPCHGYHGLAIELKTEAGRLEKAQSDWLTHLIANGYKIHVNYGDADEAIRVIAWYLGG